MKFTLRDLLLLLLVASLIMGWWANVRQLKRQMDGGYMEAKRWQNIAGDLRAYLTDNGYRVYITGETVKVEK